jgi:hypothetical protein
LNRWSRIVLGIALSATAAWVAVGVVGRGAGRGPEQLALHTTLAYAATLLWLLADIWIVVFLAGCVRAARRLAPGGAPALGALERSRRHVSALGGASVALALGQFVASGLLYPGRLPASVHLALALVALVAQGFLLTVAARVFVSLESRLEECAAARAAIS